MHVIDFKTSRGRWSEQKAQESGDQLRLYGVSASGMSGSLNLPIHLHFGVLTKTLKPIVQILDVPCDAARVEAMKESVSVVWEAIQAGHFYPNPSPINCSTCPFKSRCPAMGNSRG
jgi:hypothetical protein